MEPTRNKDFKEDYGKQDFKMFSLIANPTFWHPTWGEFITNLTFWRPTWGGIYNESHILAPNVGGICNEYPQQLLSLQLTRNQLRPTQEAPRQENDQEMITQGFYARLTAYTRTMNVPSDHWQDQVPGVIRPKQGKFKTIRTRKSRDNQSTIRKTI